MRTVVTLSLVVVVLCGSNGRVVAGHGCGVVRKVHCVDPCRRRIEVEIDLPCFRRVYVTRPVIERSPEYVEAPLVSPAPAVVPVAFQRQSQQQSNVQQQTGPTISFSPNINVQVQPQSAGGGGGPAVQTVQNLQSNAASVTPQAALALPPAAIDSLPPAASAPLSRDLSGLELSRARLQWQFDAPKARYFSRYRLQVDAVSGQHREQMLFFYPAAQRSYYIYLYDVETGAFWARCATTFHPAYAPAAPQWQLYLEGHWNLIESVSNTAPASLPPDPQFNLNG